MPVTDVTPKSADFSREAAQWLGNTFRDIPQPHQTLSRVLNPDTPPDDRNLQILETVGDRVIEVVVLDRLMQDYPNLTKQELHRIKPKAIANEQIIRLARDSKLDEACPRGWALRNALADRMEMIAAALLLDGHSRLAEEYFSQLIKPAYVQSIISATDPYSSSLERSEGTPSSKSRIIMEWLQERGFGADHQGHMVELVPAMIEYGRQREMLGILGLAAVEAAVSLLAYEECAGHAPKHFDSLVKHHLKNDLVQIEAANEDVSVYSPEFLMVMGYLVSRIGFGKVHQMFRDDPKFHVQLRDKMPVERHPAAAKSKNDGFTLFQEIWPEDMMPQGLAAEVQALQERKALFNKMADEELRLRAAFEGRRR